MTDMTLPAMSALPEMVAIYKALHADAPMPADMDTRIARVMRMPERPFTTSVEAAFALKDEAFKGVGYVNVDLREYDDKRGLTFICDIKTETGDSGGSSASRATAITKAVISYVVYEMEAAEG